MIYILSMFRFDTLINNGVIPFHLIYSCTRALGIHILVYMDTGINCEQSDVSHSTILNPVQFLRLFNKVKQTYFLYMFIRLKKRSTIIFSHPSVMFRCKKYLCRLY